MTLLTAQNRPAQKQLFEELSPKMLSSCQMHVKIENRTLFLLEINFGNSMMLADYKIKNDYYSNGFLSNFGIGAKTRLGTKKSKFFMRYDRGYTISTFKPKGNKILAENGEEMILAESSVPLKKPTFTITEVKLSNYFEYDFQRKNMMILAMKLLIRNNRYL